MLTSEAPRPSDQLIKLQALTMGVNGLQLWMKGWKLNQWVEWKPCWSQKAPMSFLIFTTKKRLSFCSKITALVLMRERERKEGKVCKDQNKRFEQSLNIIVDIIVLFCWMLVTHKSVMKCLTCFAWLGILSRFQEVLSSKSSLKFHLIIN